MLAIHNGIKKFHKKTVLDNISLSFSPGKIVGLLGENGAGKTTLLRSLCGVYPLEKGRVTLFDQPVYNNPDAKQHIGFVSDSATLFPYQKVKDLIAFYKAIYPKFSKERWKKGNELFCIDENTRVSSLSKGYQMRLSILLNMAIMPRFLLLDEPTNGLDVTSKKNFFDMLIEEVEQENTGIILSSHYLKDLEPICDEICIINHGHVLLNAEIDDLKNSFVKLQVLFKEASPDLSRIPGLLDAKQEGSIYYLYVEQFHPDLLRDYDTKLVEICPVSLEDIFLKTNERRS